MSIQRKQNWDDVYIETLPFQKNMNSPKNEDLRSIAGDMNELGWEVFQGHNISTVDYIGMRQELHDALTNSHKKNYKWDGIHDNRKILKLGQVPSTTPSHLPMTATIKAFNDIHRERIVKVPFLGPHVIMESMGILCNLGNVFIPEQAPHRDYSQIKTKPKKRTKRKVSVSSSKTAAKKKKGATH